MVAYGHRIVAKHVHYLSGGFSLVPVVEERTLELIASVNENSVRSFRPRDTDGRGQTSGSPEAFACRIVLC